MAASAVIEARNLSLTFETADGPVFALSDIDFTVNEVCLSTVARFSQMIGWRHFGGPIVAFK